jgi:hypothetical protein
MEQTPLSRVLAVVAALAVLAPAASAAPHGIFWAKGAQPVGAEKASAGGGLQYYGGPVISHPKVYAVFWGNQVDPETQSKIGPFFTNMLDSTYMDWLKEYDTNIKAVDGRQGTNQTLNRGTYAGAITISPANASTSLTDADIQHELEGQIAAGKLPAPTDDSLYMIYFPAGVSISLDNEASCSTFCAYHEGFKSAKTGASIFYGVMPVCGFGCGVAGSTFDSLSVVSSHECTEAITDPFPTPGTNPAYPQAWNDAGGSEIGDLCTDGNSTVTGHGITSAVQWEYDDSISGCNQGPWTQNAASAAVASLDIVVPSPRPVPLLEALRAAPADVFAGL